MRRFYYKMRPLLQNETLIRKCAGTDHLDYGYILYDQGYNISFHQKLEPI